MSVLRKNVTIVAGMILLVLAIGLLLSFAYSEGRWSGAQGQLRERAALDLKLHEKKLALDRWFFASAVVQPSTVTSERYTLETRWADAPARESVVDLDVSEGGIHAIRGVSAQDIVLEGNVVSWKQYGEEEAPIVEFIGTTDGDEMWGRVYKEPGQGWHEGEPPGYGVWRLRRFSPQ